MFEKVCFTKKPWGVSTGLLLSHGIIPPACIVQPAPSLLGLGLIRTDRHPFVPLLAGSGFVGLLTPTHYAVQFLGGTNELIMSEGNGNGTLAVASSDVIVVNGSTPASDGSPPHQIVLAYTSWNSLVGYAPSAVLNAASTTSATASCNVTGAWYKGARTLDNGPDYIFTQSENGSFVATSKTGSWYVLVGFLV